MFGRLAIFGAALAHLHAPLRSQVGHARLQFTYRSLDIPPDNSMKKVSCPSAGAARSEDPVADGCRRVP
jgi:hypothetical protein